jgi:hypothetical protein
VTVTGPPTDDRGATGADGCDGSTGVTEVAGVCEEDGAFDACGAGSGAGEGDALAGAAFCGSGLAAPATVGAPSARSNAPVATVTPTLRRCKRFNLSTSMTPPPLSASLRPLHNGPCQFQRFIA